MLAVAAIFLVIPQQPASGEPPTPTPTSTAASQVDLLIDPVLIAQIRIENVWKCGSSANECMQQESDAFILARVAMGEAPHNISDRVFIMWNIKLRAALGFKEAGYYSGSRSIDDRWGPETSIATEALCNGGCQYAPVRSTEGIYFPCQLPAGSNIRAMLCPTDEQLIDWYATYNIALYIVKAHIEAMPEALWGYDGFRSPSVTWYGTIDREGGLLSRQFFPSGNIWRDEYEKDNVFWSKVAASLPTSTTQPSRTPTPTITQTPTPLHTPTVYVTLTPEPIGPITHKENKKMEGLPDLLIAGIPIILIVFGIVEEFKAWGVQGNILRLISLLVGFGMAVLAQMQAGLPVDIGGWITLVVVGVIYGLTASGAYDFLNKRLKKVI